MGAALEGAGIKHRRIYDLRHTDASWSLDAGIGILTFARRMGTSARIIDATYGHLVRDATTRTATCSTPTSTSGTWWAR